MILHDLKLNENINANIKQYVSYDFVIIIKHFEYNNKNYCNNNNKKNKGRNYLSGWHVLGSHAEIPRSNPAAGS